MSEQQPEALRSLYEITGNVADANTVLVNRAELRCLHQMNLSNQEWLDKTEWVQATAQARELGQHRADVIKQRLDLVTGQRDALLAALRMARAQLASNLQELTDCHTNPATGLVDEAEVLLVIESEQDLINQIDSAITQARGAA